MAGIALLRFLALGHARNVALVTLNGPIVMASLVTALGLLPMAIAAGSAGHEIDGPMALVILGGLATSAALNLLLLPTLALRFTRFERSER